MSPLVRPRATSPVSPPFPPPPGDVRTGPRVLLVADVDYAYVGYRLREAIREFSDVDVRLWCARRLERVGYRHEWVGREDLGKALTFLATTDVVHFLDEAHPFLRPRSPSVDPLAEETGGQRLVVETLRRGLPTIASLNQSHWYAARAPRGLCNERLEAAVRYGVPITTLTPHMNLDVPTVYVPQPLDVRRFVPVELDPHKERLVVGHMPYGGRTKIKGTDVILRALAERRDIDLRIHTDLDLPQAIAAKRELDVCIDQLVLGAYGYNLMEAAALGVPCVCHLVSCPDPILACRRDGSDLCGILDRLKDGELRVSLGRRLVRWVAAEHGYPKTAARWSRIYEEVLAGREVSAAKSAETSAAPLPATAGAAR